MARVDYPNSIGWFHIVELFAFFFFETKGGEESTVLCQKRPTNVIRVRHPRDRFQRFATGAHLLPQSSPSQQRRRDHGYNFQFVNSAACLHVSVASAWSWSDSHVFTAFTMIVMSPLLFILKPTRAHFRQNLLCPWGSVPPTTLPLSYFLFLFFYFSRAFIFSSPPCLSHFSSFCL